MKELVVMLIVSCGWAAAAYHKCCPDGQTVSRRGACNDNGAIRQSNLVCGNGRWLLNDIVFEDDKLYYNDVDGKKTEFSDQNTDYCIGDMNYRYNESFEFKVVKVAVMCYVPPENNIEVTRILTIVSVVFLLLTLGFYLYLPSLRDLQGMCYISLCVSMALGYLSLGILQLTPFVRGAACTFTGFNVYFWMMSMFFWMNVICINTFRSIRDYAYLKKSEWMQYRLYSAYAWGFSFLLLMVVLITNFVEGHHWNPGFGEFNCWFQGTTETWIYFYGPILVLILANIVLFIMSSWFLWQKNRKYEVDKLNNLKHKFLLSLKLFLVMGISWVFEVASFAHGKATIFWDIMDVFNCLQGVVIFLLLVLFRRRAIRGLASKNCCAPFTHRLAEKLSPHDDEEQQVLADDTMEVRLN